MRIMLAALTILTATLATPALSEDTVQSVIGTWTGTSEGFKADIGTGGFSASDESNFTEATSADVTIVIDKQTGRTFSGYVKSEPWQKPLLGAISSDGAILWRETGGMVQARLLSMDSMEHCYFSLDTGSLMAVCGVLKRQE